MFEQKVKQVSSEVFLRGCGEEATESEGHKGGGNGFDGGGLYKIVLSDVVTYSFLFYFALNSRLDFHGVFLLRLFRLITYPLNQLSQSLSFLMVLMYLDKFCITCRLFLFLRTLCCLFQLRKGTVLQLYEFEEISVFCQF